MEANCQTSFRCNPEDQMSVKFCHAHHTPFGASIKVGEFFISRSPYEFHFHRKTGHFLLYSIIAT